MKLGGSFIAISTTVYDYYNELGVPNATFSNGQTYTLNDMSNCDDNSSSCRVFSANIPLPAYDFVLDFPNYLLPVARGSGTDCENEGIKTYIYVDIEIVP